VKQWRNLMNNEEIQLLKSGASEFGINLTDDNIAAFQKFTALLLEWNEFMNLTTITEPCDIVSKHYVDSLSLLKYVNIPIGSTLADVGCGAGFPCVPLKIIREDLGVTCIDSLNKRIKFLLTLLDTLGIECDTLHIRAEEAGRQKGVRGFFNVVTARAVANLPSLVEYCLPLVKQGGIFIAMKGPDGEREVETATKAIKELGGRLKEVHSFILPNTDMQRTLIVITKIGQTPEEYPRQFIKISKEPII
jgi:16S rRNA (guanine527-N7)-methyltransferase